MKFIIVMFTILTLLVPATASAEEPIFSFGSKERWQSLFGPTTGGSFGSSGGGGYVGAELSINRIREGIWWGLYGDGTYDFGQDSALLTAGPSVGWNFVGVDGGLALREGDQTDLGLQARLLVTIGFFGLYGRYIALPEPGEQIGQVGLYFKIPIWASEEP